MSDKLKQLRQKVKDYSQFKKERKMAEEDYFNFRNERDKMNEELDYEDFQNRKYGLEVKEGGIINEKEEKTPTQVIKENTTKGAAKIFIDEKIKARNEQIKKKTGQNYFEFSEGGVTDSSKSKSNMDYDNDEYGSKNKEMDDYLGTLMDAVYDEKITPKKASDLLQYAGKNLTATEGSFKKGGAVKKKAKDMSEEHEGMESKAEEAKEYAMEEKGYEETKSGKMVKKLKKGGMVRGYGAAIKGKNFKGIF
jgi:hypothetical protein